MEVPTAGPADPGGTFPSPPTEHEVVQGKRPEGVGRPVVAGTPDMGLIANTRPPLKLGSFLTDRVVRTPDAEPVVSKQVC